MPEFEMNGKYEPAFKALDEFTQGYIEAMFWTSEEPGTVQKAEGPKDRVWDRENESALPGDVGFSDLAPEALAAIIKDCARFQEVNEALLSEAYALSTRGRDYTPERAGHDFWLTRNEHGTGFWDRQFDGDSTVGERLSARCGWKNRELSEDVRFGAVSPYLGDDGLIYIGEG